MLTPKKDFDLSIVASCKSTIRHSNETRDSGTLAIHRAGENWGEFGTYALPAISMLGERLAWGTVVGVDPISDAFREEMAEKGVNTDYVQALAAKESLHRKVEREKDACLMPNPSSAGFECLRPTERRAYWNLIGRSRGAVIGHVPLTFTSDLLSWARQTKTLTAMVPGRGQLRQLREMTSDFLAISPANSRVASGLAKSASTGESFHALADLSSSAECVCRGCQSTAHSPASRFKVRSRSTGISRSQRVNWCSIKPAAMLAA